MKGAHKTPEFLKLNPFGQVPVLEDDSTVVFDANAILVYLANKYDAGRRWLPSDAKGQADVQAWLSAHGLLKVMDAQLATRSFLVGNTATLADSRPPSCLPARAKRPSGPLRAAACWSLPRARA